MDADLAELVEKTDRHRATFEQLARSLTVEETVSPIEGSHWRVKDYIAHLASMDIWMYDWFAAMVEGKHWIPRADDGGPFDIDKWNDARIDERRDDTIEDLLVEAAEHRAKLMTTYHQFTRATLDSRFDFRGMDVAFVEYLDMLTLHDPAHSNDFLKALPERREEPYVKEWLDEMRADTARLFAAREG
jgi:hypothetical protein